MRKVSSPVFILMLSISLVTSCKTNYNIQKLTYHDYSISGTAEQDSSLLDLLQPYKDSVTKSMNTVVAVAAVAMERKQPEGSLGNMLVDAMMTMAKEHFTQPIDIAILNYWGIRLPSIGAGDITTGKIFEVVPFDNVIVILHIDGRTLQRLLDLISDQGGWPAANITWRIKKMPAGQGGKKAINVNIAGKPLDEKTNYTMATIDYLANGGDDCSMLRSIPQLNDGYVFRNAILEYMARCTREGKTISAKIENRITDAN